MITEDRYKQRSDLEQKKGFEDFLAQPSIRLLMSMIPPSERQETMETLLSEAYKAGFNRGSGSFALMTLESLLSPRPSR